MDHYMDIRLLPDPEFTPPLLMGVLFSKLHRALVLRGGDDIGISFPAVRPAIPALGERLRLHGTLVALQQLMAQSWLSGMQDHIDLGAMTVVPSAVQYRIVRRVQAKSCAERLRRRLMQRQSLTVEQALEAIPNTVGERLDLPYVTLRSQSTGQTFRLFIDHQPLRAEPVAGVFSAYGLSPTATVPWF